MNHTRPAISLTERLEFGVSTALGFDAALAFVQDAERSLAAAQVLEDLEVVREDQVLVSARLPINTPLFGRRQLRFVSRLVATDSGAVLVPADGVMGERAWAVVAGEAVVTPVAEGSELRYLFDLTINLDLPDADHWGTRALSRMIEMTAATVLRSLGERLRTGIEAAARP